MPSAREPPGVEPSPSPWRRSPDHPTGVLLGLTPAAHLGASGRGLTAGLGGVAVVAEHLQVPLVVGATGRDVDDVIDLPAGLSALLAGPAVAVADAVGYRSGHTAVATGVTGPGH